jgi:hypothetical protein
MITLGIAHSFSLQTVGNRKSLTKWYGHFSLSGLLTPYHKARSFPLNADPDTV